MLAEGPYPLSTPAGRGQHRYRPLPPPHPHLPLAAYSPPCSFFMDGPWFHDVSVDQFAELTVYSNGGGTNVNIDCHRAGAPHAVTASAPEASGSSAASLQVNGSNGPPILPILPCRNAQQSVQQH